MNFLEFLVNCNSASFNSNCNSRSCFWHQFKLNSNSRIELEFSSHSQFNSELCTSLEARPDLNWPSFTKQSVWKWFAET